MCSNEEKEFTVHATMTECNHGGIELELDPRGDGVRWRRNWGGNAISEVHSAEILYGEDEDEGLPNGEAELQPYFIEGEGENETKHFLNNFMRVNI